MDRSVRPWRLALPTTWLASFMSVIGLVGIVRILFGHGGHLFQGGGCLLDGGRLFRSTFGQHWLAEDTWPEAEATWRHLRSGLQSPG